MESFEDSIRKKIQDKSIKAPSQVWTGVEQSLDADLILSYKKSHVKYKLAAAAAILLAVLSFALQFEVSNVDDSASANYTGATYNALLAEDSKMGFSIMQDTRKVFKKNSFMPYVARDSRAKDQKYSLIATNQAQESAYEMVNKVASINIQPETASVEQDIYPYHQGSTYSVQSARKKEGAKLWAGIEAGAGNFNAAATGNNAFTGSINQSSLASALGSRGFTNPTTDVIPNMEPGIATSIGLDLGVRIGKKWTLESGLAYTNVDSRGDASINVIDIYSIDNTDFIGPLEGESDIKGASFISRQATIEVQDSYDYDVDVRSNIRFTTIPMKAGYFVVDNRMSVRLNVGLAANYLVGSQFRGDGNVINGTGNDSFNLWSFDGIGGVELGYSLFDRFDLTLEPNYRQAIKPLSEDANTSTRFLLQTGLRYTFQ